MSIAKQVADKLRDDYGLMVEKMTRAQRAIVIAEVNSAEYDAADPTPASTAAFKAASRIQRASEI